MRTYTYIYTYSAVYMYVCIMHVHVCMYVCMCMYTLYIPNTDFYSVSHPIVTWYMRTHRLISDLYDRPLNLDFRGPTCTCTWHVLYYMYNVHMYVHSIVTVSVYCYTMHI